VESCGERSVQKQSFRVFSDVMITCEPCTGYGTMEQCDKSPKTKRKFCPKRKHRLCGFQSPWTSHISLSYRFLFSFVRVVPHRFYLLPLYFSLLVLTKRHMLSLYFSLSLDFSLLQRIKRKLVGEEGRCRSYERQKTLVIIIDLV
jgi:hypothetical protein